MTADASLVSRSKRNLANGERIGSGIAGAVLVLRALARPSLARFVVAVGGAVLLQRAVSGHWPLYDRLGIGEAGVRPSLRSKDPVTRTSEDSFPASDPPSWTPVVGEAACEPR